MHELAICESLLGLIEETAKAQDFHRVTRVRLEVGPFSGVEIEALRFGFDVVARGSLAEAAALDIVVTEGEVWCFDCNNAVALADRLEGCPKCGGYQLRVTGGKELRIKDLEVE